MKSLILLPAVDVADGQAVRLVQGEADSATSFGDPMEAALDWQRGGADWIHLVDLDAAFGRGSNREILAEVTVSVATNQPVASKSTYYTGYTAVVMQKPSPGATPPSIGYTSLTAGSVLKAILGTWAGSPAPTLQYTWYTCPANEPQPTNKLAPATCKERTKNADVTVLAEFKGLKILLLVLASNGAGTATNVSTFVTIP